MRLAISPKFYNARLTRLKPGYLGLRIGGEHVLRFARSAKRSFMNSITHHRRQFDFCESPRHRGSM